MKNRIEYDYIKPARAIACKIVSYKKMYWKKKLIAQTLVLLHVNIMPDGTR